MTPFVDPNALAWPAVVSGAGQAGPKRWSSDAVASRGCGRRIGPNRWLIDVDQLAAMPGVTIDRARLAELQVQAALAGAGEDVLDHLVRVEACVEDLSRVVGELRRSFD